MKILILIFSITISLLGSSNVFAQEETNDNPTVEQSSDGGTESTTSDDPEITYVPNYEKNLTLFYFLIGGIIIMAIIIIGLSSAIRTLVNSDYFKNKLNEKNKRDSQLKTILSVIGFTGIASYSSAFTFNGPGEATNDMPWLIIENIDLNYLLVVNLVMLGVIVYMRRMFNDFVKLIQDEKVKEAVPVETVLTKVNSVLTDAVPIEEEASILLNHEYDGIQELDNNLPPWWLWGFYATMVFAVIYIFNYHIIGISPLQAAAYDQDMAQAKIEIAEYRKKMAMNVDESNVTLMSDGSNLGKGKVLFSKNCASCHLENGSGDNGPNLTDKNWIYGFEIKQVFSTVKNGRPNGMPEHNSKLNPIEIQQVSSFVLSMPEVNGKEAQGDIIEE